MLSTHDAAREGPDLIYTCISGALRVRPCYTSFDSVLPGNLVVKLAPSEGFFKEKTPTWIMFPYWFLPWNIHLIKKKEKTTGHQ